MSLRTARRADRRLREAAKQATILADERTEASAARVDLACLAIKTAVAEQVGTMALRPLTSAMAFRAQPLGDRLRRHAMEADAAIKRADATQASTDVDGAPLALSAVPEASPSAAAFKELHSVQLHGFALLLTLGDQPAAAKLASDALAAGAIRAKELTHSSRAAAWLRHSVLRAAKRRRTDPNHDEAAKRAALRSLGVDDNALAALSALSTLQRAAVVASSVEGLKEPDVATVVGLDPVRSARLVREALRRAMSAPIAEPSQSHPDGPVVARTREIAARVLA